jgi:hypothetical protein
VIDKGRRYREVPLRADLADKLNVSHKFIFIPSRSWKSAFFQAVVKAAKAVDINLTGAPARRTAQLESKA